MHSETINVPEDADPSWFQWWVNEDDPEDLARTQAYIEQNYSPEVQEKIQILTRREE
jgi:hypothetical protein